MDNSSKQECISLLGCKLEDFPQIYLGLPISVHKLPVSAFNRYIDKTDRYLAGWQAVLLNPMGRAVLVNSVLDSQLVYAMSALSIPVAVLHKMDRRRRSFLWNGDNEATSAQSLIAWERVCLSKDQGGLGIKNLGLQNVCLLLKLLHRLHCSLESAWADWVRKHASLANLEGALFGEHWNVLRSLLPLYQAITVVDVEDGKDTSFWYDAWHNEDALADRFPALHSHCTKKNMSVAQTIEMGVDSSNFLVPRLSSEASNELAQLWQIANLVIFSDNRDKRRGPFCLGQGKVDSGALYRLLQSRTAPSHLAAKFIWDSCAPPRVQFFVWLIIHGSVQCRVNLSRKSIVDSPMCEVCNQERRRANTLSSTAHLLKNFGKIWDSTATRRIQLTV
jgi:hypothetical protein